VHPHREAHRRGETNPRECLNEDADHGAPGRLTPQLTCGRHASGKMLDVTGSEQRTELYVVCPSGAAKR
jgi:hypothetical protein